MTRRLRNLALPGIASLTFLVACLSPLQGDEVLEKDTGEQQVDAALVNLQREYALHLEQQPPGTEFRPSDSSLVISGDNVLIDAIADSDAAQLASNLEGQGATSVSVHGRMVSCYFPIERIAQLQRLDGLKAVRASRRITH